MPVLNDVLVGLRAKTLSASRLTLHPADHQKLLRELRYGVLEASIHGVPIVLDPDVPQGQIIVEDEPLSPLMNSVLNAFGQWAQARGLLRNTEPDPAEPQTKTLWERLEDDD